MLWQTAVDPKTMTEKVFRVVRCSTTETSTVTILAGSPLVLETATASVDGSWVRQAATKTDVTNHLFVGNAHSALVGGGVGLAQCHGYDDDVIVLTGGASVGVQLVPNVGSWGTVGSSTDGCLAITGGGANIATVLVAPTGAATVASKVFLRAL
jgi:hypothetical protein